MESIEGLLIVAEKEEMDTERRNSEQSRLGSKEGKTNSHHHLEHVLYEGSPTAETGMGHGICFHNLAATPSATRQGRTVGGDLEPRRH